MTHPACDTDSHVGSDLQIKHGRTVGLDIARGLAYLHSQGMVHGRLKSSNVLMNKAGVAKLSDPHLLSLLSHCRDLSLERSAPVGNRAPAQGPHIAPEVHFSAARV